MRDTLIQRTIKSKISKSLLGEKKFKQMQIIIFSNSEGVYLTKCIKTVRSIFMYTNVASAECKYLIFNFDIII